MGLQHCVSNNGTGPRAKQLADRDEIAERLRHFLALDLQESVVHPDVGHRRRAMSAPRLSNFVLMVGKDQIQATTMDVEYLAEICRTHS